MTDLGWVEATHLLPTLQVIQCLLQDTAIDDIVDLPYLTQACLGQAWNRALLLIPVTCFVPRVPRGLQIVISNVLASIRSGAIQGPTVARSPCTGDLKSGNLSTPE